MRRHVLKFKASTFCPYSVFVFVFVFHMNLGEKTKIISLHNIQRVVFATDAEGVHCAVRAECLNTGCPRRNVPDFGRVFLMLKYTDITQNTYVQS